jgi:hypothetical protein
MRANASVTKIDRLTRLFWRRADWPILPLECGLLTRLKTKAIGYLLVQSRGSKIIGNCLVRVPGSLNDEELLGVDARLGKILHSIPADTTAISRGTED